MSNITKWILGIFGALVIVLNAAETALFGATYLPAAFGNPSNGMSALLAAAYCLLMLDVAYLVWFKVWLSGEQATAQRDMAISLAVIALIGSIMATVTQLATNTGLATFLIPYRDTIGTIAFFVVVGVTVAHIVGLAVYKYKEPEQQIANKTAKIQGDVIDSALKELEARANEDKAILVDILAREFRVDMLNALGFSQELKRVGKQPALPANSQNNTQGTAVPANPPTPTPANPSLTLASDIVPRRPSGQRYKLKYESRLITDHDDLDELITAAPDIVTRDFVPLGVHYGGTSIVDGHRGEIVWTAWGGKVADDGQLSQLTGQIEAAVPYGADEDGDGGPVTAYDDLQALVDDLVRERLVQERVHTAVPAANGNGANFTNRPGGRTL